MNGWKVWLLMIANTAAMVGCWGVLIDDANKGHSKWDEFKAEHHCKVVAQLPGGLFDSSRTGWLCDDGVTYFKPGLAP